MRKSRLLIGIFITASYLFLISGQVYSAPEKLYYGAYICTYSGKKTKSTPHGKKITTRISNIIKTTSDDKIGKDKKARFFITKNKPIKTKGFHLTAEPKNKDVNLYCRYFVRNSAADLMHMDLRSSLWDGKFEIVPGGSAKKYSSRGVGEIDLLPEVEKYCRTHSSFKSGTYSDVEMCLKVGVSTKRKGKQK